MKRKFCLLLCVSIFMIFISLTNGWSSESLSQIENMININNSDYYSSVVHTKLVPMILYSYDSQQKMTATKVEYDISTHKISTPVNIFALLSDSWGYTYQWSSENQLYLPNLNTEIKNLSNNDFTLDTMNDFTTKMFNDNGTICKVYSYEKGIVLETDNIKDVDKNYINLVDDNPDMQASTLNPLLIYGNNHEKTILVHYFHPGKLTKNMMISGLMVVKVNGKKIMTSKVDMKDECCINSGINGVVIGRNCYVNIYKGLGQISIDKKIIGKPQFYKDLEQEVNREPAFQKVGDNELDDQPLIGKIGDILLISYGTGSTYYIWGMHADNVVFELFVKNNCIYDKNHRIIGSTKGSINKILLPNY